MVRLSVKSNNEEHLGFRDTDGVPDQGPVVRGTPTPRVDWADLADREHFVQFYESDAFLVDSVAGFIGAALEAGERGMVIATEPHRSGIERALKARGIDVAAASAQGRYVSLDAAATIAEFMPDAGAGGLPDPARVSAVLEPLLPGGARLRVFGEMVALLWAEGNRAAAVRLEEIWNDLARRHTFSLFCAYPMKQFEGEGAGAPFGEICSCHTRVLPAESYAALESPDERLRAITRLQQKAQSLEAEVAARKKMERRQRELLESERAARAEAERLSRMKDEFLATLSHELRTPLNAIYGWAQIMRQAPADTETVSEGLSVIERNVKLQTQLVEDLLDLGRIVSGKVRLDVRRVELAPVLAAAAEAARPAAEAKGICLRQALSPAAGPVRGDVARLHQVIWNLLVNAVKFTPEGGTVELRLEPGANGAGAVVSVRDTGLGIDPEFLPHVFERFRQADSSSTRKHGGLGIGLSIVKQLVELHGGSVGVASDGRGRGATFTATLPGLTGSSDGDGVGGSGDNAGELPAPGPAAGPRVPADALEVRLDGVKVLVVDDEPDSRQFVARLLDEREAEVITAASAEEALALLEHHHPDVLVSDIGMPDVDGYELIREIRARRGVGGGRIRAVALTAFARSEDRARALRAGYQSHMSKPIEPQELLACVASLAGRAGR